MRRAGEGLVDPPFHDLAVVIVGPWNRQGDDCRPPADLAPKRLQRDVGRLATIRHGRHCRSEGTVHEGLERGRRAEAGGEVKELRAGAEEPLLHFLVERNIGASEPVDGLLGIADQEELAGDRLDGMPVRLVRIVRGEQEEHLRLEGVCVLELVDEEMRKALLHSARTTALSRTRSRA